MQTFCRQHVGRDQVVQRFQRHGTGAHLVGQCRQAQIDALSRVAVPLPVQRQVLPVLLEEDRRQQVRARPAARCRVEGRRRLRDPLAVPTGELLPHRPDHLPTARDHLKRLRHVLANLRQPVRSAARARRGRRHHHTFARQVLGEGLARRLAADEPAHLGGPGRSLPGRQLILGRAHRELVEREFQLVEKTLLALGPSSVERATELLDHQGQGGDLRLGRRRSCLGRHQRSLQPLSVVRIGGGHDQQRITGAASRQFLTGFAHLSHSPLVQHRTSPWRDRDAHPGRRPSQSNPERAGAARADPSSRLDPSSRTLRSRDPTTASPSPSRLDQPSCDTHNRRNCSVNRNRHCLKVVDRFRSGHAVSAGKRFSAQD